jgi:hypothetical protein
MVALLLIYLRNNACIMSLIFAKKCAGKDAAKESVQEVPRVNLARHSKEQHGLNNLVPLIPWFMSYNSCRDSWDNQTQWILMLHCLHVFNLLACMFFIPSTYICCLWTNIIKKTCSSKWLIDEIWYNAMNLALFDEVLGMFYLKKIYIALQAPQWWYFPTKAICCLH